MFVLNNWREIRAGRKARRESSKLSTDEKRALHWQRAARLARITLEKHRNDGFFRLYQQADGEDPILFV